MRVLPSLNLLQPGRGPHHCGLKELATTIDTTIQALLQVAAAAGCGFVDTHICGQNSGLTFLKFMQAGQGQGSGPVASMHVAGLRLRTLCRQGQAAS